MPRDGCVGDMRASRHATVRGDCPESMYESCSFLSGHAEYLSYSKGMPDAMLSAFFFVGYLCYLSPDQRGDASLAEGLI